MLGMLGTLGEVSGYLRRYVYMCDGWLDTDTEMGMEMPDSR